MVREINAKHHLTAFPMQVLYKLKQLTTQSLNQSNFHLRSSKVSASRCLNAVIKSCVSFISSQIDWIQFCFRPLELTLLLPPHTQIWRLCQLWCWSAPSTVIIWWKENFTTAVTGLSQMSEGIKVQSILGSSQVKAVYASEVLVPFSSPHISSENSKL